MESTPSPLKFVVPTFQLPADIPTQRSALQELLDVQHAAYAEMLGAQIEAYTAAYTARVHQEAEDRAMKKAQEHIGRLIEQLTLARHRLFGVSSEQLPGQARLFDEAEALEKDSTEADDTVVLPDASAQTGTTSGQTTGKSSKKARGKRRPLPSHLERVDVVHDVPEAEHTCACGTPMVEIGCDVSEQLDIVPMQVRVLRHLRKRYGCADSLHAPVVAALPTQPLPKSNASPDFLAMLMTVKYVDGLPLARFEHVLDRHHVDVPRQTLARWIIGSAGVLQPLHNLLRDTLTDGSVIHMDETEVQVLKEKGRDPSSKSYMWVQTGGPPGRPVVLYDYDPSRGGEVPVGLLEGYRGYLMTDGYAGYNPVARIDGIERLACLAHVRRGFVDAVRVQPKGKRSLADEAVEMIGKLYRIEREHKDEADEIRFQARQQFSVPILNEMRLWLDQALARVLPSSKLGEALQYMDNQWSMLVRYAERGDLPIDNNRCERAIRPFVIGRNAWVFSDTPAGAHASAVIYSLVQTAKANGVEPYIWLRRVMRDLPAAKTVDDVEALLPWNFHAADLSSIASH
jgi:transposase